MVDKSNYIAGRWELGLGEKLESLNPATEEIVWAKNSANEDQVIAAVASAEEALNAWSLLTNAKRRSYLEKYIKQVVARTDDLVTAIAKETGKPYWEAKTEVVAMAHKLDVSVDAQKERSATKKQNQNNATAITRHKPHGVMGVIGPFNFPGHLPNGHIIPALLAGNTVVFKPSEHTPLVSEIMLECWDAVKLPPGVINMVQGGANVGSVLINNESLDGVLFTGSYSTGQLVARTLLKYPGRIIALEMGGNNPLVVTDVKDIDAAVYHTIQSAFITAGQRCTCARRLIITDDDSGKEFLQRLIKVTKNLKVGAPSLEDEPFMGPVISINSANNIMDEYHKLLDAGSQVLLPLRRGSDKGSILTPGIVDITTTTEREDKEIFGPLLKVVWVQDFAAAIAEANNTKYGLAAGLLSNNKNLYPEFYNNIKAGIINWNRSITGASSNAPFGGVGISGNHRPSAYYAADYCAYPVASIEAEKLELPAKIPPGIDL